MSKKPYAEGDVFAVPLRAGGFALGLIARKTKSGNVLFGYFWGPARRDITDPNFLPQLTIDHVILKKMFSDIGLVKNKWVVIASLPGWKRSQWPIPKLLRKSLVAKKAYLVTYADDDPGRVVAEESCDYDVIGYEKDDLLGSDAVEVVLTHLLAS